MNVHIRCFVITALLLMVCVPTALAALQCNGCHGTLIPVDNRPVDASFRNPSSGGFPGNHRTHMDAPASADACSICHPGSSSYTASHRDGLIKVSSRINNSLITTPYNNITSAFPQTATPTPGSCASVNCHFETATPTWGGDPALTTCSTCHGAPPAGISAAYSGGAAGSHPIHNAYYPGVSNCIKCHTDHTVEAKPFIHATSIGKRALVIKLRDPLNNIYGSFSAGTRDYLPSQVASHTFGTCNTTYCHSTVQAEGGIGEPSYGTPTWGVNLTSCNSTCHGVGGSTHNTAPTISTGSHTRHLAYYFGQEIQNPLFNCPTCHHWPSVPSTSTCSGCHTPHGGAGLFYPEVFTKHVNGAIDVAFNSNISNGTYNGSPIPRSGYNNCTNTYCHSTGVSVATGAVSNNTTANWGTTGPLACNSCHGNNSYSDFRKAFPLYTSYTSNSRPTSKANSHSAHLTYNCNKCHVNTTSDGVTITSTINHVNKTYNVNAGDGESFTYSYNSSGGSCASVSCHGTTDAQWGSGACLGCHSVAQGNRAAITGQFAANSHHIQGAVTDAHCYQCHWEANSDGSINQAYHNSAVSGAAVRLVVYSAAARPRNAAKYFIAYTANGTRAQIQKISNHCLGCHSDQNNNATPFGDGKTPKQYAWDGSSVAARYSQSGATSWGKYTSAAYPNAAKKKIAKALSAHGNAGANQRGWNTATGVDGVITNTSGAVAVQCYDCHNSHGSAISGITSRYSSATGRQKGGILKDTARGFGGYSANYRPTSGGSEANKNVRNPGASLCIDCHLSSTPKLALAFRGYTTPWGYSSTYGASQAIIGYFDSPYMAPGTAGPQVRYPYKNLNKNAGGHFGASSDLSVPAMATIDGLCTPCHDPHGASLADPQYSVPLLKGTWITSPYKEDVAPAANVWQTSRSGQTLYYIDQNTFGTDIRTPVEGMTQSVEQSSGLCLGCHPKSSLTNGVTRTWKSKDRIHESVKGWKTANEPIKHNFSCSKCHSAHNGSVLPRLMVTNCLNSSHKGQRSFNAAPVTSGSSGGDEGDGFGRIPGSYYAGYGDSTPYDRRVTCHESPSANGGSGLDQGWNEVTQWAISEPIVTSPTATVIGSTTATLGANVTSNGGAAITARGMVWGTSANPTGNAAADGMTTIGSFTQAITGLPVNSRIFYRGYATNSAGTGYSVDGSFYTEPSTQASAVNFTPAGPTGMTVRWTRGTGGDGVIILMKQGSAVDSDPDDGTFSGYMANPAFGSGTQIGTGNYVIHKGSDTSVAVTGLTGNTTYHFAVYEYKGIIDTIGTNQGTNYKLAPATGNQATSASIKPTLTLPTATAIGSTTATLGANVTSNGGATITERGTVWGTTASPTGNPAAENEAATGVFTQTRTGLPAGTKIYYRGYATNSVGTEYSPDGSFYTEPSTQASAVNFTSVGETSMTANWTLGSGDGVIVFMKQGSAVDLNPTDGAFTGYTANPAFGSGTHLGSGNYVIHKGGGTSVAVTGLISGTTYHLAVYEYQGSIDTSGVNQGTNYKLTPATGSQATNGETRPEAATLVSPSGNYSTECDIGTRAMTFSWGASLTPNVDYYVQVDNDPNFLTPDYTSGWLTAGEITWNVNMAQGTWYWRVGTKDRATSLETWSTSLTYNLAYGGDCGGSCPMLYTWDGDKFIFETDLFPRGSLGRKYSTGFQKPNPNDYYVLVNNPVVGEDGRYQLRLVEERLEIDYLDNVKLYTVDVPKGLDVYSEIHFSGTTYVKPESLLHTVGRKLRNPRSITHVNSGKDVSALLAASDEKYLVLSKDKNNDFNWQTIELDLGDLSQASRIKLIINARTAFFTTAAGSALARTLDSKGQRTRIEVLDANNNWVRVPRETKELPIPKEFRRDFVVDISNILLTKTYKVRLSFLNKTYVDAVYFDTTPDEPITINEVPLESALLEYHGLSAMTGEGETYGYNYGVKRGKEIGYLPGKYTRFGDVIPLLRQTDDKFVIFGVGDELQLGFKKVVEVPEGKTRRFLIYTNGYYKAKKFEVPATVEPLPFAGMSNFPYDPEIESYPGDADHTRYRLEYNIRVPGEPAAPGKPALLTEVRAVQAVKQGIVPGRAEKEPIAVTKPLLKETATVELKDNVQESQRSPLNWLENILSRIQPFLAAVLVWLRYLFGL